MSEQDWITVWLTLKLALIVTGILLLTATPLAWWLSQSHSRYKPVFNAVLSLPMVLPPTVLGFYLLLLLGPHGPAGQLLTAFHWQALPFSFAGIVLGSVLHSLPFAIQPIQNAFEAMGSRPLEVAATLRASPLDRFFSVALPLARPGLVTAAVMAFCHSIGEFGVVLMIGGSIPGETKVLSILLYEHVENQEYQQAHWMAGGMVLFAMLALILIYWFGNSRRTRYV
jgi:molybdate transport system permease protein